ncbi:MAG TPA: TlpA disulfide reductase family protein [Bryobacteraceae bacterium]|nr:TlpA disulfide reductase family protein [Bryobacteraceae bacterium]
MRILLFTLAFSAFAQQIPTVLAPPAQNPPQIPQETPAAAEQRELLAALNDANQSAVDIIRVLEAFMKKHPDAAQRADLKNVLARAAIEAKDDRRVIEYGVPTLANAPGDVLMLDRVTRSLLALGGRENAEASLKYSIPYTEKIETAPPPDGKDIARKQEDRDRALARALGYQSRAQTILGDNADAEKLAARAFSVYACEETARQWSDTLQTLGREQPSLESLADAFEIPDGYTTDAFRAEDRKRLGERYRKLHGSEAGLGDLILAAYDRTAAVVEERRAHYRALDPNLAAADAMQFTLTGLDGNKLPLASLKGSVVILDFWATWCTPCRAQHPLYEQVRQRFKDRKDVVFLSIDTDENRALVAPFLDQQKWSRSIYFDDGLQRLLAVTSIPTTVIFDKQGAIASRMVGFLPDKFADQLAERIQYLAAEPAVRSQKSEAKP